MAQTISDLPPELHCEILKYALYEAQGGDSEDEDEEEDDDEGEDKNVPLSRWKETDIKSPLQFPYNVAGVCRLWHSILIGWPQCWTRVIVDVASNPQRFLDIFLWSKDFCQLEVAVINTHKPDPLDLEYKTLERQRVAVIVEALRPHIHRCRVIALKVALFTSLPSPVTFLLKDARDLEWLILSCEIDNGGRPEDYAHICDIGVRQPIQECPSFPKLYRLSMTGFWFMHLASHPYTSRFLKGIRNKAKKFSLGISRFEFQNIWGDYSVTNFVIYCSDLEPLLEVELRHLSLNADFSLLETDTLPYYSTVFSSLALTLEHLSPKFLQFIFLLAKISPRFLRLHNCVPFYTRLKLESGSHLLSLDNMNNPPLVGPRMENISIFSKILPGWTGFQLSISRCSSFTDEAFEFMHGPGKPPIQTLYIVNCRNFTVRGLRQFMEKRNAFNDEEGDDDGLNALRIVTVKGTCPFPSQEDQEWFKQSIYARATLIDWISEAQEGSGVFRRFETPGLNSDNSTPEWMMEDYAEGGTSDSSSEMDLGSD